jgi:hypothetical protein
MHTPFSRLIDRVLSSNSASERSLNVMIRTVHRRP